MTEYCIKYFLLDNVPRYYKSFMTEGSSRCTLQYIIPAEEATYMSFRQCQETVKMLQSHHSVRCEIMEVVAGNAELKQEKLIPFTRFEIMDFE